MSTWGRTASLIVCALVGAFVPVARAQRTGGSQLQSFDRTLQQIQQDTLLQANTAIPLDQRMTLEYGGYVSYGYTSLQDNNNDTHEVGQTDLYAYGRLNIDGAHEFFLRYHGSHRDYYEGEPFTPDSSGWYFYEFDRAYYRFDLARSEAAYHGKQMQNNLVAEVGRDYVYWANGLVLAQTLQGGFLHANVGPISVDGIASVTPKQTVDFDSSRPDFDINTHRGFYGVMTTVDIGTHHPFVYFLNQRDYNHDWELHTGQVTTKFDYNSIYFGFGSNGNFGDHWVYGLEVAREFGQGLSNSFDSTNPTQQVTQTQDPLDAWAGDFRVDYLLNDIRRTRITGEVIWATGSDNRVLNTTNTFGGNQPNSTDYSFNAFGALNTSLSFAPNVSNIISTRLGASTFPIPSAGTLGRLQVGADVFLFNKYHDDAPIDEPTTLGTGYLGWEPDMYLNWQITSDVTFAVRYGVFFPNGSVFLSDQPRQFLYLGVTYAF